MASLRGNESHLSPTVIVNCFQRFVLSFGDLIRVGHEASDIVVGDVVFGDIRFSDEVTGTAAQAKATVPVIQFHQDLSRSVRGLIMV
jgi:hypothetical protein